MVMPRFYSSLISFSSNQNLNYIHPIVCHLNLIQLYFSRCTQSTIDITFFHCNDLYFYMNIYNRKILSFTFETDSKSQLVCKWLEYFDLAKSFTNQSITNQDRVNVTHYSISALSFIIRVSNCLLNKHKLNLKLESMLLKNYKPDFFLIFTNPIDGACRLSILYFGHSRKLVRFSKSHIFFLIFTEEVVLGVTNSGAITVWTLTGQEILVTSSFYTYLFITKLLSTKKSPFYSQELHKLWTWVSID